MILPDFIRVENGHEMEVYPLYDRPGVGAVPEEIIFWCHSCDPDGNSITSAPLDYHTIEDAYVLLGQYARLHEEGPVES